MEVIDNGKYGPSIRNFFKRRTMFGEKIQIRVAIDLNSAADKVQPLRSTANDTSNRHEEIRYFDDRSRRSSF